MASFKSSARVAAVLLFIIALSYVQQAVAMETANRKLLQRRGSAANAIGRAQNIIKTVSDSLTNATAKRVLDGVNNILGAVKSFFPSS